MQSKTRAEEIEDAIFQIDWTQQGQLEKLIELCRQLWELQEACRHEGVARVDGWDAIKAQCNHCRKLPPAYPFLYPIPRTQP